jgi:hypothetical protein
MPKLTKTDMSCGVYMLEDLGGQSHVLIKRIMAGYKNQATLQRRNYGFAQVVWSDADRCGNGDRLFDYIKKRYPNTKIVRLRCPESPTTHNDITTYIWNIPHTQLVRDVFYKKVKARSHDRPWRGVVLYDA